MLQLVQNKIIAYLLARLTEQNTVLSWILGIEGTLHIDKLPPSFNADLAHGLVWLTVAVISLLPQQWKPASDQPAAK
jgi:hypothetical protein